MPGLFIRKAAETVFVVPVSSVMAKALNTSRLVRRQVTVNRGGKTFQQYKWMKPGEAGGGKEPPKGPPHGGSGGGGQGSSGHEEEGGGPPRKEIKVGEQIGYSADGREFVGTVSKIGFDDGVIVKDERGKEYPVEWDHIREPKDSGPTRNDSGSNRLFSESDEIRKLYKKSIKHEGWRNGETGIQPFNDFDGLHAMCEAARGDFLKNSQTIVKKFQGLKPRLITRPTLKDDGRIKEKIREDDNGSGRLYDKEADTYITREIRDVDGHTFSVNTVAEVQRLLEHFDHDPDIVRVKNNYAKPTPVGYSDINMNIKLPNGTIAEIQLNTHANIVAKEKYGHALYEVWRSTYKNPEFKELADIMGDAQKKLYGLSNMYSREGTFPDIGDKNPFFEVEHKPYADAIRGDVVKAKELFRKAKLAGVLPPKTVKHFEELIGKVAD